jgi:membrane associated rhomboid family serine protease
MPSSVFALLVLSGAALYFMTPDERTRLLRSAIAMLKQALGAVMQSSPTRDPFDEFLHARTAWPVVTPLLLAAHVLVFALMLFDRSTLTASERLIAWGGNFAPRTTNGEWWRLLASTFVHGSLLHLLATIAGLVPLGLILERAVGRITFACVYLAAAVLASVVALWSGSAMSIGIGASGAICGIYGLLVATVLWAVVGRLRMSVPLATVGQLAGAALIFFAYNLLTDHLGTRSELAGLGIGFVGGFVIARGVTQQKPAVGRALMVATATVLIAIAGALPLRGIVDVRPEIARIAAFEERTAAAYDAAVDKFKRGRLTPEALGQVIDRSILPELQSIQVRLQGVRGVPREQAPLVAAANEYCKLREQSWRRRSEALHKRNMKMLRDAELSERAALDAFQKLRTST